MAQQNVDRHHLAKSWLSDSCISVKSGDDLGCKRPHRKGGTATRKGRKAAQGLLLELHTIDKFDFRWSRRGHCLG